ncbi:3-hydroxyisobutyrate dehydrogenase-like beta-hydroxyacid dehydrogenase [Arthrobacter woluwensis]|uniref:NAD(P)-dependent oxidoreductase n=1 Tax=Arthrobacter woluwensis TaxID=156980 RepID=UPI0027897AB9|nr:NAD(P)-dependent oxidoreductase [Arthrobacter woluwensis]MDQ0707779.1 3-hydroxyisobutyrate dehydrogenase-like beta-hydroxyacid dehydrogenase [Arthrobacter woluwensis]
MAQDTSIALLGLGPMGDPMSRNLLAVHPELVVWNRTASKTQPLVDAGARAASSPAEAAAAITLTVLPDLAQVEALLSGSDGLLAGWADKGVEAPVLVVHGTVSPTAVAAFAEQMFVEHGVSVVDAPVSGGTAGARQGTLSIMVGGDEAVVRDLDPVFRAMGSTVRHMGPSGAGALAKACNQVIVAATVTAVSEAMLLARAGGLDLGVLLELLRGGLADSEVLRQKGTRWITGDFDGGGNARNQLKDLGFVHDAATARGLDLPLSATVTELFSAMVENGDGALDHTGIQKTLASRSAALKGGPTEARDV